jgi:ureidoglycolate hydrolase
MEMTSEPLDPAAFAPYGAVLRRDPSGEPFQPLHTDSASAGWRVAILNVAPGPMARIHRHPDSEECFSPLSGEPCIAVAEPGAPHGIRVFRLDEPVCIRRHVWHEVVARAPSSVFIAENATITGEARPLCPAINWSKSL